MKRVLKLTERPMSFCSGQNKVAIIARSVTIVVVVIFRVLLLPFNMVLSKLWCLHVPKRQLFIKLSISLLAMVRLEQGRLTPWKEREVKKIVLGKR